MLPGLLLFLNVYQQHPNPCPRCGACATLPMWEGLERVIRNYLDGITLQDLLEQQTARAANDYVI